MAENDFMDENYINAISELSLSKSSKAILNTSYAHTKLLTELMIEAANKDDSVYIYSGGFSDEIYKDGILKAKAKSITILINNDAEIQWINELPDVIKNSLSIYKAKVKHPHKKHFLFTSSGAYRFEIDSHSSVTAANFYDPATVEKLHKIFSGFLADADLISGFIA